MTLDVTEFPLDQLRQVFEWDEEGWDFETYESQMRRPDWTSYAVWRDGRLIGCITLELRDAVTVSYHRAFAPWSIGKRELRRIVVGIGMYLFQGGIQRLEGHTPQDKPQTARFATFCGFYFLRSENGNDVYGMTAQDYFNNPAKWDAMLANEQAKAD